LTNTPDTNPAVFSWADVGADTVAQANDTYAGIAKLYNGLENENTDGAATQAALVGALEDAPDTDDEADERKIVHRRGIFAMLGAALSSLATTAKTLVGAVNELVSVKLNIQQSPDDEGKAMVIGSDGRLAPGVSGKVDSVDGVPPGGDKDVRLTYFFDTEAEFDAASDTIPAGARVVKNYEYPAAPPGYSTDEVNTGKTWIDGKPIYRRAFTGNIVAGVNVQTTVNLSGGADDLVDNGGWWQFGSNVKAEIGCTSVGSVDSLRSNMSVQNGAIVFNSISAIARTGTVNNAYRIWAEYTKI
jgi:hypothetical protein